MRVTPTPAMPRAAARSCGSCNAASRATPAARVRRSLNFRWRGARSLFLAGAALVASLLAPVAHAADEIHWTITGPTSVTFDWRGLETKVRYGFTTAYGDTVTAGPPSQTPTSSPGPFWEARITGLFPDTLYHYSIVGGADHTFRTPRLPGDSDFTVCAEGDIGSTLNYVRVGQVQQLIADHQPDLVLILGDISYGNSHGPAAVDQHFNDVMVWSQDAAYMPAWGNHEYEASNYADDLRNYKGRLDLPNPQTSPGSPGISCCGEDWSWFDYGNVRFIALPEPWPGAWADWYTKAGALMDDAQANPDIAFIVTYGHRPAYSSGHHPGSPSLQNYLGQLGMAHTKYKLDLCGHSHDYERTYPMNGVTHITVGVGGASMEDDPNNGCLWLGGCPPPPWSAFRAFHHGALKLSFSHSAIKVEALCGPSGDPNDIQCIPGTVFDSVTIGITPPEGTIDSPVADVEIAPGDTVMWEGTGYDPDGDMPLTYYWDFGGGARDTTVEDPGPVVFNEAGVFQVEFTVVDGEGFADPTPDTRTVYVGEIPNRAPNGEIVSPAGGAVIEAGQAVMFQGAATDPDGDTSFTYEWNFDEGAPISTEQNPGMVTFPNVGVYVVTFTVSDSHGLSDPTPAVREITVLAPNILPIAALEAIPSTGNEPLMVTFDATGSNDPDGRIIEYYYKFGDGTGLGPIPDKTVSHGYRAGVWNATVTVGDDRGGSRFATVPLLVAAVLPGPNHVGNPSVETDLQGWNGYAGAMIEQVPGGFDGTQAIHVIGPPTLAAFGVNDAPNWVATTAAGTKYRFSAWVRSPSGTGAIRLQVREFNSGSKIGNTTFSDPLLLTPGWQLVSVDRIADQDGSTLDFQVLDAPGGPDEEFIVDNFSIREVPTTADVAPLRDPAAFTARLAPNPLHLRGDLAFRTPVAGPARIEVIDLTGRRVRTLLDDRALAAGEHHLVFDARDAGGNRLPSGVYFFRVQTAAGSLTRRFAILH